MRRLMLARATGLCQKASWLGATARAGAGEDAPASTPAGAGGTERDSAPTLAA
jgi:hypothetical protein